MRFKGLLVFLAFSSLLAILVAYVLELFFKLPPCKLCYYQRIIFLLLGSFSVYFFFRNYQFLKLVVILLLLGVSTGLAFYHMGIEKNWFKYSSECTTGFVDAKNYEEYKAILNHKDIVACDQIMVEIFGISLAGWNFIYSGMLLFFTIILGIRTNWFKQDEIKT